MGNRSDKTLVVVAAAPGERRPDGAVTLSRKFVEGMRLYQRLWQGDVWALIAPGANASGNLDLLHYDDDELGFRLKLMPFEDDSVARWLRDLSPHVVMGGADHRLMALPDACRRAGIPFVCCTEYSLRTHYQIIRANGGSRFKRAKRAAWITRHMAQETLIVRRSAGLQANGTPTYDLYRWLNGNSLLYFDSRTRAEMLATPDELDARIERVRARTGRLRLMFSGRLNEMKGADHLPKVAAALARRGVDFDLDICGDGVSRPQMEAETATLGLTDRVHFKGVLDFETELVPYMRQNTDIFVCCHRQGDPSCTYLETAGCAVPMVGYDNEAFVGILKRHAMGVAVPMDNPDAVAKEVIALAGDVDRFRRTAREGLEFARANTFEEVFAQRIAHLRETAR